MWIGNALNGQTGPLTVSCALNVWLSCSCTTTRGYKAILMLWYGNSDWCNPFYLCFAKPWNCLRFCTWHFPGFMHSRTSLSCKKTGLRISLLAGIYPILYALLCQRWLVCATHSASLLTEDESDWLNVFLTNNIVTQHDHSKWSSQTSLLTPPLPDDDSPTGDWRERVPQWTSDRSHHQPVPPPDDDCSTRDWRGCVP